MRIGFDVTPLCVPQSGVGTYTINLLEHLNGQHGQTGDQILPIAHCRPAAHQSSAFKQGQFGAFGTPALSLNKTLWMQAVLPWQLGRLRPDICHFTNSVGSIWTACRTVVTVHDTTPWLMPKCYDRGRLLTMRAIVPIVARRAQAIIADSHRAKQDIARTLGVPPTKIHVVHVAAAPGFRPLAPSPALETVRRRERLPDRFVLHAGTLEPRKNLVRLVEAFALLRRHGLTSHGLVLVGNRGWRDATIFAAIERLGLRDEVRYLGHVSVGTLVALYNLADALVYPSLYEGFGLPMVEAMACGTPVVASPNGALREVGGDAAEYVEPTEIESIAAGLRRILTGPTRREEMRSKGLARAAHFSWATTAAHTRELYARVAAQEPMDKAAGMIPGR